ncbi:MAG: hypothetical protein ACK4UJ_12475, partial [Leptonema sp. (in: bacteria)]
ENLNKHKIFFQMNLNDYAKFSSEIFENTEIEFLEDVVKINYYQILIDFMFDNKSNFSIEKIFENFLKEMSKYENFNNYINFKKNKNFYNDIRTNFFRVNAEIIFLFESKTIFNIKEEELIYYYYVSIDILTSFLEIDHYDWRIESYIIALYVFYKYFKII